MHPSQRSRGPGRLSWKLPERLPADGTEPLLIAPLLRILGTGGFGRDHWPDKPRHCFFSPGARATGGGSGLWISPKGLGIHGDLNNG